MANRNGNDLVLKTFSAKCKEFNLKITPQRVSIYKEIIGRKDHPSTDAIFQAIRKIFPNISFDTINRTLLTFTEIGLIKLVEGHGFPKRYDANLQNHHHFFCTKCGEIVDFISDDYDNLELPESLPNDFKIVQKRVILSGICSNCNYQLQRRKENE